MAGHTKWSEIKRAKGVPAEASSSARSTIRRAEAAWTAGNWMIARGERPMYRVVATGQAPAIEVRVVELPWLVEATATRPSNVLVMARAIIAEWLDVDGDRFDVEHQLDRLAATEDTRHGSDR